jgi:hypothetical protein
MKHLFRTLSFPVSVLFVLAAHASQFHVSPSGTSGGNGSPGNPWPLQTALNHPAAIQPGDTIWLHAGTYVNPTNGQDKVAWNSRLKGTATKPIIVRSAAGERVILDGGNTQQNGILRISGDYAWYWGFEVMSSDPGRFDPGTGSFPDVNFIKFGTGIDISSDGNPTGNKFINLIVHDTFNGFGSTNTNDNSQSYGCLFFNNGWKATDRPHGHNIYIHNGLGRTKSFTDCITWGAFESNVQAWSGSDADMDDFTFDGHVAFFSGDHVDGYNFLLGSSTYRNPIVTNGMFYVRGHTNWNLGYGNGNAVGGDISGNYVGGGTQKFANFTGTTFTNNFIWYESLEGTIPAGTGNTLRTSRPTANKVFVRKSLYEPGRANVVVFNWTGASSVSVDLSAIYSPNDTYYIVDAQNPSSVLLTGTYTGPISVPMTGTSIAQPVGNSGQTRTHTPSEFGCFLAYGGSAMLPGFALNRKIVPFGTVVVGSNRLDSVTVTNTGAAPLVISSVTSSNGTFTVNPASAAVQPAQSRTFYLTFTPVNTNAQSGNIVFTHSAASSPDIVAVSGSPGDSRPPEELPVIGLSLEQNYPNPFNPSTHIEFTLPNAGYATVTVFNTLGEDVATLVSGEFSAGRHVTEWHVGSLPSGVYFYRLTAGAGSVTRHLILIK